MMPDSNFTLSLHSFDDSMMLSDIIDFMSIPFNTRQPINPIIPRIPTASNPINTELAQNMNSFPQEYINIITPKEREINGNTYKPLGQFIFTSTRQMSIVSMVMKLLIL